MPMTANAITGDTLIDTDLDGIPDVSDNAPYVANPGQEDADGDGIGDVADNAPTVANPDQADADNDGVGDVVDNAPVNYNPDQADADGDGIGDVIDPDFDSTAPSLTAGRAVRQSVAESTVAFTSNESGAYYYGVVDDGADAPTVDTSGEGSPCGTTETTINLDSLSAGAKDIYIKVKDAAGNVSNAIKTDIPAYHVCRIDATSYTALSDALTASVTGDTITLLDSLTHTSSIELDGLDLTLDLNGHNLSLSGGHLMVTNGSLSLDGEGEFNIESPSWAVYTSSNGSTVVTNATSTANLNPAVWTSGEGSSVTVLGDATSEGSDSPAARADDEGSILINGDAYALGSNANGVYAQTGGHITIDGDLTAKASGTVGAYAASGGSIWIKGNLDASGANSYYGMHATGEGTSIQVDGDVLGNIQGIWAEYSASAIVMGDVAGSPETGIFASNGGGARVYGDVNARGMGLDLYSLAEATIDGKINSGSVYIRINGENFTASDITTPTTKEGYLTYSNTSGSAWVAVPSWGSEINSASLYEFGGGDGSSEETAYEISTANQLAQLAYNVNNGNDYSGKYFKLANNIDLDGRQWTPIGHRFYPGFENGFNGTFDGNGKTVSNILIGTQAIPMEGGEQTQAGLFGATKYAAELKNINVIVDIHTNDVTCVGGLLGYSESGITITNCSVSGSLSATGSGTSQVGGLIGYVSGTTITDCSSDATITAESGREIGGLVGYHGAHSYDRLRNLSNSIFTGRVDGGNALHTGGIAGRSYGNAYITNSINEGSVSAANGNVGGIAGQIHNKVANCYNIGSVSNSGNSSDKVGGIVAFIDSGYVKNCYNAGTIANSNGSAAGALVSGSNSYTTAANLYTDRTVNPAIPPVYSTNENSLYLYSLTTDEMKGGAPSQTIVYANGLSASGEGAIVSALNGWIDEPGQAALEVDFARWDMDSSVNGGYPFLEGVPMENNAELDSISISYGTLSPEFDRDTNSYTASVSNGTSTLTVSATPRCEDAYVTINGESGTIREVDLSVGSNVITIEVTAENGVTEEEYTVTATRAAASSGGSSSTRIVVTAEETDTSTVVSTEIDAREASSDATADVSSRLVSALISKAERTGGTEPGDILNIDIEADGDIESLEVSIDSDDFSDMAGQTNASLRISSEFITVEFDEKAMDTITSAGSDGEVSIFASRVDPSILSEEDNARLDGRPVFDLTVTNGGTTVSDFGEGHATVSIPYELKEGEDPNSIVVFFVSDDGSLKAMMGMYDAESGRVIFRTPHFSKFAIVHNKVAFDDVAQDAWYKEAVEFIAAREITSGTAEGLFSPESELTRGQFIVLLMNAYEIATDASDEAVNFDDAGDTYYTPYLLAAKELGIVNGIGDNMFAPERAISRQEMCVMLYNALSEIGELPEADGGLALDSYTDAELSADWAAQALDALSKAKVINGSGNEIMPLDGSSRAEMAQVLYKLLSK